MPASPDFNQKISSTCDLLVIGSGAGGLSAAITAAHKGLKVVVLEKASVVGGTTAWSGGWLWVPHNPLAKRAGIHENAEVPKDYLKTEMGTEILDPKIEMFLETAPQMVSFFENNTALDFIDGNKMPDFHKQHGSADGGRSIAAAPFDGKKLGKWIHKLRPPLDVVSIAGLGIGGGNDMGHFFNATKSLKSFAYVSKRITKHLWDLIRHGRAMQLRNGNALAAALLRSALDKNVSIFTNVDVTGLIGTEDHIDGVDLEYEGQTYKIKPKIGVVLATGGFPHDHKRMNSMFPVQNGRDHYSAAPFDNTGDGINMAENKGIVIEDDFKNINAWSPVSIVTRKDGSKAHFPHLIERAKPGFIAVTSDGNRFTNEADSYHDFMEELFKVSKTDKEPECWIIADHKAQRRWGLGYSRPAPYPTFLYQKNGYLKKSNSVQGLANECGIDEKSLEETISRFNKNAINGNDPDFNRGASAYNQNQGDLKNKPNPSLAPLLKPPFYAVKIVSGSLGTFAGIPTDGFARVLNQNEQPIKGLFAVGNDMSSIFKGFYPSGGITLGPAMTFGFIIGCFAAGEFQTN